MSVHKASPPGTLLLYKSTVLLCKKSHVAGRLFWHHAHLGVQDTVDERQRRASGRIVHERWPLAPSKRLVRAIAARKRMRLFFSTFPMCVPSLSW
jgi:hypothetical protein